MSEYVSAYLMRILWCFHSSADLREEKKGFARSNADLCRKLRELDLKVMKKEILELKF